MAGRKSKYETHVKPYLEYITAWCRDGATDKQIAEKLGISLQSYYLYKKQFPEFLESVKVNKELADLRVVNGLYQRAVGFTVDEEKVEIIDIAAPDFEGKLKSVKGSVRRHIIRNKKHYVPDTTAQMFWLKNRQPDKWRDKHEIDSHFTDDTDVARTREVLASMTLEEKRKLLKELTDGQK